MTSDQTGNMYHMLKGVWQNLHLPHPLYLCCIFMLCDYGLEKLGTGCLNSAFEFRELVAELVYIDCIDDLKRLEDSLELL